MFKRMFNPQAAVSFSVPLKQFFSSRKGLIFVSLTLAIFIAALVIFDNLLPALFAATVAVGAVVWAFLTGYADLKDGLKRLGQDTGFSDTTPSASDLLKQLDSLKARREHLSETELSQIEVLEKTLAQKLLQELQRHAGADAEDDQPSALQSDQKKELADIFRSRDAMDQQVTRLLALSKVDEALSLLEAQAKADTEQAQSHWRRLGRLAYNINTPQALRAYENVVALGSEQIWDAVYLARLQQRSGDLAASHTTIDNALQRFPVPDGRNASREKLRDVSVLYSELGDIRTALGDLSWAEGSYRADLAIAKSLAEQDPGNVDWQRDLSVSYNNVGDLQRAQGDLSGAEESYRGALDISVQLVKQDPGNADWQRDLSVSYERIGDLQRAQGDLSGAEESYRGARDISVQLVKQDPGNADWQRDLSVSYNNVGDLLRAQGDLSGAEESCRGALDISVQLVKQDPGNVDWQRDLSISFERLGDLKEDRQDIPAAIDFYRKSLPVAKQLADKFPTHPQFVRDVQITERRLAELEQRE